MYEQLLLRAAIGTGITTQDALTIGVRNVLRTVNYQHLDEYTAEGEFQVVVPVGSPVTSISTMYLRTIGHISLELLANYTVGAHVDSSKIANVLTGRLQISRTGAALFGSIMTENLAISDTQSLYAKGFCLMFQRMAITKFNACPAADRQPIALNYADANSYTEHTLAGDAVFVNMSAAVRDGSINLLAKNYTPDERNCVKHLAKSGHSLALGQNTHEPRLNRVDWYAIQTVVW